MKNKIFYIISFALLTLLMCGHVFNISVLVLASVVLICILIVTCKSFFSTGLLFFFFPFSYIFAYNQYDLSIFLVVAYIIHSVSRGRIYIKSFYTIFLIVYCFLFADYNIGNFKLGTFIPPILVSVLIFVCEETKQDDYGTMIGFFKNGFIISSIIGFFKEEIPSIARLFDVDFVNDSATIDSNAIQRYSGLTYDPNFFSVVNCVLIVILLFTTKKFNFKRATELMFFIVTGLLTFSKSYILMLSIILLFYVIKRRKYAGRNVALLVGSIVTLVLIESVASLDLIEVVLGRFESSGETGDITTGRMDIWKEYILYILNETKVWIFGAGLNAIALSEKAVHNTYLEFMYRFGLLGSMVWLFYFILCYFSIQKKRKTINENSTSLALVICLIGFLFLSAFHFQQFWCCICLAFFAMFIPKEDQENAGIKCYRSDI